MVEPLKPGSKIGILGGGQLGRMLALAGAKLGFDMYIYEPEPDCPAGRVAAHCVTAPWHDLDALDGFARDVDVVTFEFENVPAASLAYVGAIKPLRPAIKSLELTQDRLVEKRFINQLGLPTAPFAHLPDHNALMHAQAKLGPDAILKTRRFGYDGKGQIRIDEQSDLSAIWAEMGEQDWIFESFVRFSKEVSVVLARAQNGDILSFDVTENVHRHGILRTSYVPAAISVQTRDLALAHAAKVATALDHVGVLAVEFFVTENGDLIVNEIAPRVHNSGHWTQDGCNCCQFEQHIRAVAGWPLGDPARHAAKTEMTNLIGDDVSDWQTLSAQPATFVHLYGKREVRPGRKMGHVNRIKA